MNIKKLLVSSLLVFVFPIVASAKSCTVVKGTGNNIGDEIVCGTENFYLLEKNGNNIKMLSKYNLYVGDKIIKDEKTFVIGSELYPDYNTANTAAINRCDELEDTYGPENVEKTFKYTEDFDPTEIFCRIFVPLEYDEIKQSELAIGLYPSNNMEVVYPIYGSVILDEEVGEKEFDDNLDMIPETSQFYSYLDGYTKTLKKLGVNVIDIGYIKKSGIENLINTVSDKKIKIPTYSPDDDVEESMWEEDMDYNSMEMPVYKFNIKEYIPEKYNWLYGTTYWIGSATLATDGIDSIYFDEFLSTVGDYCSYLRGCTTGRMGIGLRPVVTIDSSQLNVEKKDNPEINPNTGDNILIYFVFGSIFLVLLLLSGYKLYKE